MVRETQNSPPRSMKFSKDLASTNSRSTSPFASFPTEYLQTLPKTEAHGHGCRSTFAHVHRECTFGAR